VKVVSIVGARPQFIKAAAVSRELRKEHTEVLVHTGQHYDPVLRPGRMCDEMSQVFFDDLDIPRPDVYLGVGSGSHAGQTARVMLAFEPVVLEHKPDLVLVVGDVNSTLACTLVCAKIGVRVAHVEAGLRSFDPSTMLRTPFGRFTPSKAEGFRAGPA